MDPLLASDSFEDVTFRQIEYPDRLLQGREFRECRFLACDFSGARLRGCRFVACRFEDCDLSLAEFPESRLQGVEFRRCKLVGVDWTTAHWASHADLFGPPRWYECVLDYGTFVGVDLSGAALTASRIREADFSAVNLSHADLSRCDLLGSRFENTNLTGADLTRATGYLIAPQRNQLKQARFSLPEVMALLDALQIEIVDPDDPQADETTAVTS